ncbi:MAG TPA: hypothetical protein VFB46_01905, partial [Gemmatimonadaceae bacterium]|nr:hypothetical protein [Gemmatimonadaceae bacterium]
VEHGLGSIYRAAALFLTNKENMVASTGHFEGTELNSDRLIGSVGANLATVYRVLFGMRFEHDRLRFRPFVPRAYGGERTLRNFRYRGATLTITVRGFGNALASAALDGVPVASAEVPAGLTGAHRIELTMNGVMPSASITVVENRAAPATPQVALRGGRLVWRAVSRAVTYVVHRNAERHAVTTATQLRIGAESALSEYQVMAMDGTGGESFLSEPIRVASPEAVIIASPTDSGAWTAESGSQGGHLRTAIDTNASVQFTVDVPVGGTYAIEARYANGSGPVNTGDKAAIRSILVDGVHVGSVVMPQRGTDLWSDWGYSSALTARLSAGTHGLTMAYTPADRNMNGAVNTALIEHLRLTRLTER